MSFNALFSDIGSLGTVVGETATSTAASFLGDPVILISGIILIVGAAFVILFLKKILVNSLLGLAAWVLIKYAIGINLPLIPSLVLSVVFGLAGVGSMLLLVFFGII